MLTKHQMIVQPVISTCEYKNCQSISDSNLNQSMRDQLIAHLMHYRLAYKSCGIQFNWSAFSCHWHAYECEYRESYNCGLNWVYHFISAMRYRVWKSFPVVRCPLNIMTRNEHVPPEFGELVSAHWNYAVLLLYHSMDIVQLREWYSRCGN